MDPWLLVGSLAGVLLLAAAARMLGLGGAAIADEAAARRLAEESLGGFRAGQAFVSRDGRAALVQETAGGFALLKVHGAHVAVRRLDRPDAALAGEEVVRIASGERMFGDVRLDLPPEDRDRLMNLL